MTLFLRCLSVASAAMLFGSAVAQPAPIKFGKPDPKDFLPASFVGDSAAAVVLCDYGTMRVGFTAQNFQSEYERVCRIKILRNAGFDWATVQVPLYSRAQKMVNLRGFTYNLVNGVVAKEKLSAEGQYSEDLTKRVRVRKFTMPNVREGSVIEFSYTLLTEGSPHVQDWQFQRAIPVRWSEYRVSALSYFDYRTIVQGYWPLAVQERKEGMAVLERPDARMMDRRWAMKDIPAFVTEPHITTPDDFVSRLDFELASISVPGRMYQNVSATWEKVDAALLEDETFGAVLDRNGFLKEALAAVPAASAPLAERVAAVHALVRDAVKYNDEEALYATGALRKVFLETHRGSAADVNLLLITALRTVGIDANPVVLSTRSHGRLNEALPLVSRLNYVVAHVLTPDGKDLLLDATEPLLPAGALPERCLNQVGRLVMKEPSRSRWLEIKPQQRRVHFQRAQLSLTPQGRVRATVHEEYGGYNALDQRGDLRRLGEPKYRSQFARQHSNWTLPSFAVSARDAFDKPLALDYEYEQAEPSGAGGETLYLNVLEEFVSDQNPFRSPERTYPVDFATGQEEVVMLTLKLPEGYGLDEVPKGALIALPDGGGRYTFDVQANGTEVQLMSRLSLQKAQYSAEEYVQLRELYRLMLAKQAEKLVVRRKA